MKNTMTIKNFEGHCSTTYQILSSLSKSGNLPLIKKTIEVTTNIELLSDSRMISLTLIKRKLKVYFGHSALDRVWQLPITP
ncbi:MAG: hypothetical protein ACJA2S_005609 [Cyclobacteriaceae bacterium]|jgi:hypothetical protein